MTSRCYLFGSLSVNIGYETRDGNPEEQTRNDNGAHDVVLQELEDRVQVEVVDEIPDSLNHVLHCTLTSTLKKMTFFRVFIKMLKWIKLFGNETNHK